MEEPESIFDYLSWMLALVNQVKANGKKSMTNGLSKSLTLKFKYIIIVIVESRNLSTLLVDGIMGSIQVHE